AVLAKTATKIAANSILYVSALKNARMNHPCLTYLIKPHINQHALTDHPDHKKQTNDTHLKNQKPTQHNLNPHNHKHP
ncbi:hypothetical protein RA264_29650, partial [Pseudomonas syringae pv. tagetis]|uniref:hypothetical protein n=1 Tax=Pseudomonas syringae group genomosp. 7 TaxID=251699 RepID=UPI003770198E